MRWYAAVTLAVLVVGVAAAIVVPRLVDDDPDVDCSARPALASQADIVERVGGLVTDDYTVRYARASEVGVVALVEGDVGLARQELPERYDVAIVAEWDAVAEQNGKDAFAQLDAAVAEHCP